MGKIRTWIGGGMKVFSIGLLAFVVIQGGWNISTVLGTTNAGLENPVALNVPLATASPEATPVVEPSAEPTPESSPEPSPSPATLPLVVPVPAPTLAPSPAPKPIVVPSPKPVASPAPKPVSSPAPKPTPKPKPKPKPAPAPSKAKAAVTDQNILSYYNADRAAAGLAPLAWSACLGNVALGVAQTMANNKVMAHGNGLSLDFSCVPGPTGENLAAYPGPNENLAWANSTWMASSGHRANILNPAFKHVALAYAVGSNGEGYYAVELTA